QQLITIRGHRPLNRIHAKGHRRRDRPHGLPPHAERIGSKEAVVDSRGRREDEQALLEPPGGIQWLRLHRGRADSAPSSLLSDDLTRSVCTKATSAQTCSLDSSSENTGIFGSFRPFPIR